MTRFLGATILCVGLLPWAGAVLAQSPTLEATVFPIERVSKAKLGKEKARLQSTNIGSLIEKIYAAIKPPGPPRQPVMVSLQGLTLASFKRLMRENSINVLFTEILTQQQGQAVTGTGGKTPRPDPERIPVKNEAAFESGRHYEVTLSRQGYETGTENFEVERRGTSIFLQFGNSKLSLRPSGSSSIGFLVDATEASTDANARKELRTKIGKALETNHHMLRWFEDETLDALITRPLFPYNIRFATPNSPAVVQGDQDEPTNPKYLIKLKRLQ